MSVTSDRRWMERLVVSGGEGSRNQLQENRLDVNLAGESGDSLGFCLEANFL